MTGMVGTRATGAFALPATFSRSPTVTGPRAAQLVGYILNGITTGYDSSVNLAIFMTIYLAAWRLLKDIKIDSLIDNYQAPC